MFFRVLSVNQALTLKGCEGGGQFPPPPCVFFKNVPSTERLKPHKSHIS